MKRLMSMAFIALGLISFSATAQETETTEEEVVEVVEQEYVEIDKSQLPQTIKDAVLNDLDGMAVVKAYVAEDATYKITVASAADQTEKTLYADAEGNWLKPDDN